MGHLDTNESVIFGGSMKRNRARGFSLMELMVALSLGALLMTMGFTGLNKAKTSGGSRGLATAVAGEFRLAREKAIAKGSPVAVVVREGVSQSLFFLEGETLPVVTRTVNYEGDYPYGAICSPTYAGPSFGAEAPVPGSKSDAWKARLASWLPSEYTNDSVFMFTPNGSVVTNGVPSAQGLHYVVVAMGATVSGRALTSAAEPQTVTISQSGAVEQFGRLLGSTGGVSNSGGGASTAPRPPAPQGPYTAIVPTILKSRVTPAAEEVDGNLVHVLDKGEYLALEIFAHSGDGRPLYAGWMDTPVTKMALPNVDDYKGAFSVPGGELERMEFYPEFDVDENGSIDPTREVNIWRSVWTWTPPPNADSGDKYDLSVDVTDATHQEKAAIRDMKPVVISPPGEIVFERRLNPGERWHLYTMWADGTRVTPITKGNHDYRCASATADGKLIAYERDGREVWVMNADGTGQIRVTDNGDCPTISPTGNTVSFMRGNSVVIRRIDIAGSPPIVLPSARTAVVGAPNPSNRIAYSPDGKWVYYTASTGNRVDGAQLNFTQTSVDLVSQKEGRPVPNIRHVPQVGGLFAGRHGNVYYHADSDDPYIGRYETGGGEPGNNITWRTSRGQLEAYPSISPNEDLLLYCEKVGANYQIFRITTAAGAWTNANSGHAITGVGENLRPAWIRQDRGF